jgi:hypothetical protein
VLGCTVITADVGPITRGCIGAGLAIVRQLTAAGAAWPAGVPLATFVREHFSSLQLF